VRDYNNDSRGCCPYKLGFHLLPGGLNGFNRLVEGLLNVKWLLAEIRHLDRTQIPGANPGPDNPFQIAASGTCVLTGIL